MARMKDFSHPGCDIAMQPKELGDCGKVATNISKVGKEIPHTRSVRIPLFGVGVGVVHEHDNVKYVYMYI